MAVRVRFGRFEQSKCKQHVHHCRNTYGFSITYYHLFPLFPSSLPLQASRSSSLSSYLAFSLHHTQSRSQFLKMINLEVWLKNSLDSWGSVDVHPSAEKAHDFVGFIGGGLFLEPVVPASFVSSVPPSDSWNCIDGWRRRWRGAAGGGGRFLSVSLSSVKEGMDEGIGEILGSNGEKAAKVREGEGEALNTINHLWAGAVAAMISRTFVAPLERLKLEYIVRGERKDLFELIQTIATTQGLKGFWKGNFVNILRTAPFKAINFYAYDTYRDHLLKMSGKEESTNFERFVAGAAAGITATVLCIPMDTIRTVMVAPGGEALGGVMGAFRHMIQTEGFFSLYKGLGPSIISMAPSGAVFYGVYDILKSAYLHSPEGRKRLEHMKQEVGELNALEQLELGTMRTLIYGAVAGACAEAATYPFEVVRRQLQMQVRATKMSALATTIKIVEQGGVPALYAGLIPSLLQVLPSAAISYFVYECMKIVLKVE